MRRIIDPEGGATVRGRRQNVTALFTDVRDFTTISEQHSPEEVVDILSAYFEMLNTVAEQYHGTVIQYLGDSIFVIWNAPVEDPQHIEHGCHCALAMKAAVDRLNETNRKNGRPELFTRFGVHTGPAVVGSFGAIARQQYGDGRHDQCRLAARRAEQGVQHLDPGERGGACRRCRSIRLPRDGHGARQGTPGGVDLWELVSGKAG